MGMDLVEVHMRLEEALLTKFGALDDLEPSHSIGQLAEQVWRFVSARQDSPVYEGPRLSRLDVSNMVRSAVSYVSGVSTEQLNDDTVLREILD
jgi:hypothetical protein